VPTYEYRCPNGHTFEVFQRMSDPPVEACEVCGAAPVEKVLFPVAVHFKGSGFYSTDYGRGSRKSSKDGDGSSGDKGEKAEKKDSSTTPAADSGSSTKDTKSS
jgi:putative FmdB family regulatory protein